MVHHPLSPLYKIKNSKNYFSFDNHRSLQFYFIMLIWIKIKVNGGFFMARGKRKIVTYTGKALKVFEKVQRLESELKKCKRRIKNSIQRTIKRRKGICY